jgi:hypothetical protein
MAGNDEAWHHCPVCGAGATWASPLEADKGNGAWQVRYCAECGTCLGEERAWHDLGPGRDAAEDTADRVRRWLRAYVAAR